MLLLFSGLRASALTRCFLEHSPRLCATKLALFNYEVRLFLGPKQNRVSAISVVAAHCGGVLPWRGGGPAGGGRRVRDRGPGLFPEGSRREGEGRYRGGHVSGGTIFVGRHHAAGT